MNAKRVRRVAGLAVWIALGGTYAAVQVTVGDFSGADDYGSVPVPGSRVVHLPAGDVQVAYKALIVHSTRTTVDLPVPALDVRVEPANGDGPPATLRPDIGDTIDASDDVHARVMMAAVPREADYRVTAQGDAGDAEDPAVWLGHGSGWARVLAIGLVAVLLSTFVWIASVRRMRHGVVLGLLVLLAGCGGDHGASAPAPAPSPTPPPTEQLKYDMLTAAIQLEAYKLTEHTYTDDETKLGPAFPPTVTIKAADATSFSMAAYDDRHIRYALIRTDGVDQRTCHPATPDACPDGRW